MAFPSPAPVASSSGSPTTSANVVKLDKSVLTSFKPTKVFKASTYIQEGHNITSVEFDDKGEMCVTASDDETIQLYDARAGK